MLDKITGEWLLYNWIWSGSIASYVLKSCFQLSNNLFKLAVGDCHNITIQNIENNAQGPRMHAKDLWNFHNLP